MHGHGISGLSPVQGCTPPMGVGVCGRGVGVGGRNPAPEYPSQVPGGQHTLPTHPYLFPPRPTVTFAGHFRCSDGGGGGGGRRVEFSARAREFWVDPSLPTPTVHCPRQMSKSKDKPSYTHACILCQNTEKSEQMCMVRDCFRKYLRNPDLQMSHLDAANICK